MMREVMMSKLTAATANLGCGGVAASTRANWAMAWLTRVADESIDLLFLQEAPHGAFPKAFRQVYDVFGSPPSAPVFKPRSFVAVRKASGLAATRYDDLPNAYFHGTYLAAATVALPHFGEVVCVSVHASPTRLSEVDERAWVGDPPTARVGGGNDAGRLWHADYVLVTLGELRDLNWDVLAAGDFNEARQWDEGHSGETWGREFFERAETLGLTDPLVRLWETEQATRQNYQIDHILASPRVASFVANAEIVAALAVEGDRSDHLPISFELHTDTECQHGVGDPSWCAICSRPLRARRPKALRARPHDESPIDLLKRPGSGDCSCP